MSNGTLRLCAHVGFADHFHRHVGPVRLRWVVSRVRAPEAKWWRGGSSVGEGVLRVRTASFPRAWIHRQSAPRMC
eukprot:scaffold3949_cov229-Pinguiococcus_pyrenoidosus.AAC.2